jgi:hypothetical protein
MRDQARKLIEAKLQGQPLTEAVPGSPEFSRVMMQSRSVRDMLTVAEQLVEQAGEILKDAATEFTPHALQHYSDRISKQGHALQAGMQHLADLIQEAGKSPGTEIMLGGHMPDTVVAKVIHTSGGHEVAYLNGQQVRVNLTKKGNTVAAEFIPSHGNILRADLRVLSGAGQSRMSLSWGTNQVIVEIL